MLINGISHTVQRQTGVALVLVLWMLALLTVMALSYSSTMRMESRLTLQHLQSTQAAALAEAGIWLGVYELLRSEAEQTWSMYGAANVMDYGDGQIEISLLSESGKIDLNSAKTELLQALLDTSVLNGDESAALFEKILDWRDRDNLRRQNGAEDDEYRLAGLEYGAKDAWFNSVEELRMIPGMTEAVYADIAPALTVYSHQTGVNPLYAPPRALLAVPGTSAASVEDYLFSREDEAINPGLPSGADSDYFNSSRSNAYTVSSTGIINNTRMRVEAALLLKPNAVPPVSVLAWRVAPPSQYD